MLKKHFVARGVMQQKTLLDVFIGQKIGQSLERFRALLELVGDFQIAQY